MPAQPCQAYPFFVFPSAIAGNLKKGYAWPEPHRRSGPAAKPKVAGGRRTEARGGRAGTGLLLGACRSPRMPEEEFPVKNESGFSPRAYSSSSDASKKPPPRQKKPGRARRSPNDNYDTDYNTGAESGEELDDDDDWDREYPPITSDYQRQDYKKEFDTGLQEYKKLQAELDEVTKSLATLDEELDAQPEGSQAYAAAADEYNHLKDIKSSTDYKNKRKYCKQLKGKLNHIKRMVNNYDNSK
ncbi:occludin-like [Hyperolius riggenbachi]|uniref:occludin-like n=1 Tax=Hyperolius riggenbachi TaxID=752182 RepID=UPI0035A37A13